MRQLLQSLKKRYPNDDKDKINHWVNCQYARKGVAMGMGVTLRDVDEYSVVNTVERAIDNLSLPFEDLYSSIKVVARINSTYSAFEPVIHVGFAVYQRIFIEAGMVINDLLFGFNADEVIYSGSQKHIEYTQGKRSNDSIEPKVENVFINYELPAIDIKGSLIIDAEEISAVKESGINNGLNGVNPYSDDEWLSIAAALVFKRLMSDANFTAIVKVFPQSTVTYVKDIIALSEECYGKVKGDDDDNLVYSSYGKVIARKFKRFNIMDKKKHEVAIVKEVVAAKKEVVLEETALNTNNSDSANKLTVMPVSIKERSNLASFSKF